MACIWMDGFEIDFPDNTVGLWNLFYEETSANGYLRYVNTHPRTGSGCVQFYSPSNLNSRTITKTLSSSYTELYIGFGIYIAGTQELNARLTNTIPLVTLLSTTGNKQITFGINDTTSTIMVHRGNTTDTLLGASAASLSFDTMHYVELHAIIDNTIGAIQVRIDGNLTLDLSGIDTNVTGNDIKSIELGMSYPGSADGSSIDMFIDDFIVNDTTGTVSNSWPNGAGIERLDANADGTYSQWTSTGGAIDYTEVDDLNTYGNVADGVTILTHATNTERTSVQLDNTTIAGNVQAIMLITSAKNESAGSDDMSQFVRLGATNYDSPTFIPPTTFSWHTDILTLNPATSAAWQTSEIDGMELGWVIN